MHIDVSFGAIVTLKNYKTGGGYLHSHWHLYPEGVGAKQQQVIIYKNKKNKNILKENNISLKRKHFPFNCYLEF